MLRPDSRWKNKELVDLQSVFFVLSCTNFTKDSYIMCFLTNCLIIVDSAVTATDALGCIWSMALFFPPSLISSLYLALMWLATSQSAQRPDSDKVWEQAKSLEAIAGKSDQPIWSVTSIDLSTKDLLFRGSIPTQKIGFFNPRLHPFMSAETWEKRVQSDFFSSGSSERTESVVERIFLFLCKSSINHFRKFENSQWGKSHLTFTILLPPSTSSVESDQP